MAKPKLLTRKAKGSFKYITCSSCNKEIQVDKPHKESAYYCGNCGGVVENTGHRFCGWCGEKFDWD